jgi:ATP adenylyltransferase
MNSIENCKFCNIVKGKYNHEKIDKPFYECNNYFSVASIGALIEGWTLVVPKEHQLSMKLVYEDSVFLEFVNKIIPILSEKYGPLIAFEHGANKEGSITACGTDHAHLHIVPYTESLIMDLDNSNLNWINCDATEIKNNVGNEEYLFYYELGNKKKWEEPVGKLHILEKPISQFFRHLIAQKIGKPEEFNYKKFPNYSIAEHTQENLSKASFL